MSRPEVFAALRRDLAFLLDEVLDVGALRSTGAFSQFDADDFGTLVDAAIEAAAKLFAPCAEVLDAEEPAMRPDGSVCVPDELATALNAYIEGGYLGAALPEDVGGMGLPYVIAQAMYAAFFAANAPAAAYPMLTAAAANVLRAFGTDAQKATFLRPMVEGRYFGTMVLSEPEAGSSLADLRTRAIPQADGTYHIVGNKMWISGGEHDLSENIVHLVLARIEGAPAGIKGISMFLVPKRRVNPDGTLGPLNGVTLTGLNHKMGYRGTINTALAFGADAPCVGTLVGTEHRGMATMFHMMNEARTGVGLGATMMGYAGYRVSLEYARERVQGRHPDRRGADEPAVPILEHADVRRMLLTQKVYVEGGLGLGLYCAKLIDEHATATDAETKEALDDLLAVLTPIAKAWPSEFGPRANDLAIQVLGGAGYTRDWPLERYYRDNRLNPIHEGTNGIQGLDLLGRKVTAHQGRAFRRLLAAIRASIGRFESVEALQELTTALDGAVGLVAETTMKLGAAAMGGNVRLFLANATEYLHMLGHVVIAWMWLEQAGTAAARMDQASEDDRAFLEGKLHAARFFTRYELPRIERQAALLQRLDDTALTMPAGAF
ncbi:MAG: acyl-CoA dehydrogenase [Nannocystaceae bacterium]|nr:acyl-CoA dehydrogenase [bacterium]